MQEGEAEAALVQGQLGAAKHTSNMLGLGLTQRWETFGNVWTGKEASLG